MCSRSLVLPLALVAILARATQAIESDADRPDGKDVARMLVEVGSVVGGMAGWYWTHIDLSREDFEMGWDDASWERKLTSLDALRLDTNGFYINAISHPVAGTYLYQGARANDFGVLGASLIDLSATLFWEYVVEYRELPSLNDIIVNTMAGPGLAEPAVQISRALRRGRPTAVRRALSLALAPFEVTNGWMDKKVWPRAPSPSLRTLAWAGVRAARFGSASQRTEAALGADFELIDKVGYGKPGAASGAIHAGAWSRLDLGLDFGPGGYHSGLVGARLNTRTALTGRYTRDIADSPTGARGWGHFFGLATGFAFDIRRLAEEWDRLALVHVLGPQLQVDVYLGAATLRWELLGFGDFGLVQAHVFGPRVPFHPDALQTSALRSQGYYYGLGGTLASRLRLEAAGWDAELSVRGHAYRSIDGLDRHEIGGPEDPHGVADQRAVGRVQLGMPLGRTGLGLMTGADVAVRRGTWEERERDTWELAVGLSLTTSP